MNENTRRNALKVIAASAPAVWAKPVASFAVMPAHAATSCQIVGFSATVDQGEVEGIELDLSPLDAGFNGEAELVFQTEFAGGLSLNTGNVEIENGVVAEVQHELEYSSTDAEGGQELGVTVTFDETGAICTGTTVTQQESA